MEISSFKIDGHTMPFNYSFNAQYSTQYSIINDNNDEFCEFYLKTKPSTSSVNGCKVVDNDNELNKPFEKKNCSNNYCLLNSKENIIKYKEL